MKVEIPLSPFCLWEKVRMRAIKGFLSFSYFRVPIATSMDDSERSEESCRFHTVLIVFKVKAPDEFACTIAW